MLIKWPVVKINITQEFVKDRRETLIKKKYFQLKEQRQCVLKYPKEGQLTQLSLNNLTSSDCSHLLYQSRMFCFSIANNRKCLSEKLSIALCLKLLFKLQTASCFTTFSNKMSPEGTHRQILMYFKPEKYTNSKFNHRSRELTFTFINI